MMDIDEAMERSADVKIKVEDHACSVAYNCQGGKEYHQLNSMGTASCNKNGNVGEGKPTELIEIFCEANPSVKREEDNVALTYSDHERLVDTSQKNNAKSSLTSLYDETYAIGANLEMKKEQASNSTSSVVELATAKNALVENSNKYQSGIRHVRNENLYSHQIEMPPLCGTRVSTPILSIQFSPLLSFSEDRGSTNNGFAMQLIDMASGEGDGSKEAYQDIKGESVDNHNQACTSCNTSIEDSGSFMTSSWTPSDTKTSVNTNECNRNNDLTYADNLLLHASQGRQQLMSSPIEWKQKLKSPDARKKRKIPSSNQCRSNRQPQKRFSVGQDNNDISDGDLFVSKRDGRVRLTTNLPRAVEALDPESYERLHLYASCSEAAREMGINRTRMSRTCRGGGGQIGDFFYQYVEMSGQDCRQELEQRES